MTMDQIETMRQNRKNQLYLALSDVLDVLETIGKNRAGMDTVKWTTEDIRAFTLTLLIDQQRKYTQ